MKTSAIVCTTSGRLKEIIRCCDSLYKQIELPDEFIIVDSSEEPIKYISKFIDIFKKAKKIDFHYINAKCGLPEARNIGINKASGDILYFFDDDVILEADYLQVMNKTFKDNPKYMGGMGGFKGMPALAGNMRIKTLFKSFFLLQHDYGNGKFYISGLPQHSYGINKFMEVEVLGGCFMAYRKKVMSEFKFDENLGVVYNSYMEDADFSRRVSYKYKLFYNPEAKLEHRRGITGRGSIKNNRKMYMINHRYFYFKNFYSKNRLYIIAHWWSILGLIVYSLIFESKETTKGYIVGLMEFSR